MSATICLVFVPTRTRRCLPAGGSLLSLFPPWHSPPAGDAEAGDLQALVARLQAELSKAQAEAAESHQANLTLGAELAVLERKQRNQVGQGWLHIQLLSVMSYLLHFTCIGLFV